MTVAERNLVAYWRLNEASGTRADALGLSPLTAVNNPLGVTGLLSNAAQFVGASFQYLTRPDDAIIGGGDIDWTFNFWLRWTSAPSGFPIVLAKDNASSDGDYVLYWNDPLARFTWEVFGPARAACGSMNGPTGMATTGVWYMITLDHSATTNTFGFRVNGGARTSAATTGPAGRGAQPFIIGNRGGLYLTGLIDEFSYFKDSLSDAEAAELYNGGAGVTYPFPWPAGTIYRLGPAGATVDLTDATAHVVLAQGFTPRPTRERTLVAVSGRDAVRLSTSQGTAMEIALLLGITGATHDALIANWNEIRAQVRRAREWALEGRGAPVEFTAKWYNATAPIVYDVIDGDFPPPPALTNPVVSQGQMYEAVLTLICQPYGRAVTASAPSSGTLTNDTTGWTFTIPVAGDEPAPARLRIQNKDATGKGFARIATRTRGNPANFTFPITPGTAQPGITVTLLGGSTVVAGPPSYIALAGTPNAVNLRIEITANVPDHYGAFRVHGRFLTTLAGYDTQLRWGGPSGAGGGALIANEVVVIPASAGLIQVVDLGRMNIPEQEVPSDVTPATFAFSLWSGNTGSVSLRLYALELWPAENYVEVETTTLIAQDQYAVIDSLGRSPTVFLADSSGNRVQTLPHVGTPPILPVAAGRVLARLSRSRLDDRPADQLALDARYYNRYEMARGAG